MHGSKRVNRQPQGGFDTTRRQKMLEWNKILPDVLIIIGIMIAIRITIIIRNKLQPYNKKIKEREEQLEKAKETLDEIWPDRPGIRRKKLRERREE